MIPLESPLYEVKLSQMSFTSVFVCDLEGNNFASKSLLLVLEGRCIFLTLSSLFTKRGLLSGPRTVSEVE